MLNQNYRKFVSGILNGEGAVQLTPYLNGNLYTPFYGTNSWSTARELVRNGLAGISVIVGRGDTEPTTQDTQLADMITDLTYVTSSMDSGNGDYIKVVSVVYKNNTSEAITIKEIGLAMCGIYSNASLGTTGSSSHSLLGRIVLDVPIVMNSGDVYTFTYGIE